MAPRVAPGPGGAHEAGILRKQSLCRWVSSRPREFSPAVGRSHEGTRWSVPPLQPVTTPIIHLNGDRRETLLDNLEHAYTAVSAAQDALRPCAGNARNFYPEPGRFERYQAQHRERQEQLQAVLDSLTAEAEQIQEEAQ